jgi:hypothetical protein
MVLLHYRVKLIFDTPFTKTPLQLFEIGHF